MLIYAPDKDTPVEVPDNEVGRYIQSGYRIQEKPYRFKLPDGSIRILAGNDAQEAFLDGLQIQTEQERKQKVLGTTEGAFYSGLMGALKAPFLGADVPGMLMAAAGKTTPEEWKAVQKASPTAHAVGEIGGLAASTLFNPTSALGKYAAFLPAKVAGLGSKVVKGTEASILGSLAKKGGGTLVQRALARGTGLAGGGAVEGSIYGLTSGINESMFEPELTGELLASHLGWNTLLGGTIGGVGGFALGVPADLLGKGLAKTASLITKNLDEAVKVAPTKIKRAERDAIFGALNMDNNDAVNIATSKYMKATKGTHIETSDAYIDDMAKTLRTEGMHPDGKPILLSADDYKANAVRLEQTVQKIGGEIGDYYKQLDNVAGEVVGTNPKIAKEVLINLSTIGKGLDEIATQYSISPAVNQQGITAIRKLQKDLGAYKESFLSYTDAHKLMRNIEAEIPNIKVGTAGEANKKAKDIVRNELERAIDTLSDVAKDNKITATDGKIISLADFKKANNQYFLLKDLQVRASEEALKLPKETAKRDAQQFARSFFGSVAWHFNPTQPLSSIATSIPKAALSGLASIVFRNRGGQAAVADFGIHAAKLRRTQEIYENMSKKVKGGIESFMTGKERFKSAARTATTVSGLDILRDVGNDKDVRKAARNVNKKAEALLQDPNGLATRIASRTLGLEDSAPQVAMHIASTLARQIKYIGDKSPKQDQLDPLQPGLVDDKILPSKEEALRLGRILKILKHPETIMDEVNKGTLTPDMVDALKTVNPKFYENFVMSLLTSINTMEKRLSQSDRIQLSILVDAPLDFSMTADFIKNSQAIFKPLQPAKGQGGNGTRITGLAKMDVSGYKSTSQRLEEPI